MRAFVFLLTLVVAGLSAQPAAPGPGPAGRGGRGGPAIGPAPVKGPCPLPILTALPAYEDSAFYANTDVPHGALSVVKYKNQAGEDNQMHVYLPPDYGRDSQARYPVLYLNHGAGDDDARWSDAAPRGGAAGLILDNLIAAGKARAMIVVMPNSGRCGSLESSAPGKDDACIPEFAQAIIPYIDSHYRTRPHRESRAIAGLSKGGFVAVFTGLPRLDLFSEIYTFSGGLASDEIQKAFEANYGEMLKKPETAQLLRVPLYVSAGETDFALAASQRLLASLNKFGFRNFWVLHSGGHEWANWRRTIYQTAQIMFPDCPAR